MPTADGRTFSTAKRVLFLATKTEKRQKEILSHDRNRYSTKLLSFIAAADTVTAKNLSKVGILRILREAALTQGSIHFFRTDGNMTTFSHLSPLLKYHRIYPIHSQRTALNEGWSSALAHLHLFRTDRNISWAIVSHLSLPAGRAGNR